MNTDVTNLNCVETLSDNEINELLKHLIDEKDKRKKEKRQVLIEAFHAAVYNLMEAGVNICFVNDFDEYPIENPRDDFIFY